MKPLSSIYLNLIITAICLFFMISCNSSEQGTIAINENYSVLLNGNKVGYCKVSGRLDSLVIDYDYKSNGRGPTIKEFISLNASGLPIKWDISGNSTFGNTIDEHFEFNDSVAEWTDATGTDSKELNEVKLYVNQFGSPYSLGIVAKALLKSKDKTLSSLPSGTLTLTKMEEFSQEVNGKPITLISYALSGADLDPEYFVLDKDNNLFASISPRSIVIREGYEAIEKQLRTKSEDYSTARFESIQKKFAHNYGKPVRIQNVRIFDPLTSGLTALSSVVVEGDKIKSIEGLFDENGEILIDGKGGTLVAGLYDMHAHMGENDALLNVLAGVTSVRDMGNDNTVLDTLLNKIESGVLVGPRITRLGLIEGKSEYNTNGGILVESEEEALEAVDYYAERGFYGVKLYNSMNGDWAPAIAKKAHGLGLHVAGHVPAFSDANTMIAAGFNELTHINQVILGWILEANEDTRTLLRLTALKRFPNFDITGGKVSKTMELMVQNNVAMDPTLAIHELLMLSRNGETQIGRLDYVDNMPANVQRSYKVAPANIADEEEDIQYREAYEKIVETLRIMKEKGILIIPGTDLGGAFTLHREMELYLNLGYTPSEVIKLASYDMAKYLGHNDRGQIIEGKLADFFLVPGDPTANFKAIKSISMVCRGGIIYYPSEVYPEFGIKPFTEIPAINKN